VNFQAPKGGSDCIMRYTVLKREGTAWVNRQSPEGARGINRAQPIAVHSAPEHPIRLTQARDKADTNAALGLFQSAIAEYVSSHRGYGKSRTTLGRGARVATAIATILVTVQIRISILHGIKLLCRAWYGYRD